MSHLHDLDWLHSCELARAPEIRQWADPRHTMPEGQALRALMIAAIQQVVRDRATMPNKRGVRGYLEGYLEGKSVVGIARRLGVSREWVARGYRKEEVALAVTQLVGLLSRAEPPR